MMTITRMPKKKTTQTTTESQIQSYLEKNKEDHFNFEEIVDYKVSSGSLLLDIEMNGGIRPGILRMSGASGAGKTSCILSFAKNFQDSIHNGKVIFIKSEGRLGQEMKDRSGLDFSDEKWFEYKCNIYESVIGLIRELVMYNDKNRKYLFIIDSMDALSPRNDVEKPFEEANKVAGAALLTSTFLKRMALAFSSKGHICALVSQVRSTVSINPYQRSDPKLTNASGGNAALHYSDWILEFQKPNKMDHFFKKEKGKDVTVGHNCKVIFRKTPNEKTNTEVVYPIRHGRKDGNSVWIEREVKDMLLMWELATAKGAWISIDDDLIGELAGKKIEFQKQHQGEEKFCKYLEENPKITKYLFDKFKNVLDRE